jgi:hypothetical protein
MLGTEIVRVYKTPHKRYCLALDLKNNPLLIEEYLKYHSPEHLMNPEEFWGEWVIPSISPNDPAYPDQAYWRGRVWPPMNMLVYMDLKNYGYQGERKELAEKTTRLMLKDYR